GDAGRDGARALRDPRRGRSAPALRPHLPPLGRAPAGARGRGARDRGRAHLSHVAALPHLLGGGVRDELDRALPGADAEARRSGARGHAGHARGDLSTAVESPPTGAGARRPIMRRREFLKTAAVGGATLGAPVFLRNAWAQGPIKIGMPAALSGAYAQ